MKSFICDMDLDDLAECWSGETIEAGTPGDAAEEFLGGPRPDRDSIAGDILGDNIDGEGHAKVFVMDTETREIVSVNVLITAEIEYRLDAGEPEATGRTGVPGMAGP